MTNRNTTPVNSAFLTIKVFFSRKEKIKAMKNKNPHDPTNQPCNKRLDWCSDRNSDNSKSSQVQFCKRNVLFVLCLITDNISPFSFLKL
jgi:hypothetical protein